jgi:hypothetical protein
LLLVAEFEAHCGTWRQGGGLLVGLGSAGRLDIEVWAGGAQKVADRTLAFERSGPPALVARSTTSAGSSAWKKRVAIVRPISLLVMTAVSFVAPHQSTLTPAWRPAKCLTKFLC